MDLRDLGAAIFAAMLSCTPVAAQEWFFTPEPLDETFGGFVARVTVDDKIQNGFEDNYILAGLYQRLFETPVAGVRMGAEIGLAGRFGERNSAEVWTAVLLRADFELFNLVRISPSTSLGVSAVTAPLVGGEEERQDSQGGDARLLFYLGPEIAMSLIDSPQHEVFVRLHHRSGAWHTLGNMIGGQDSIALGYRYSF